MGKNKKVLRVFGSKILKKKSKWESKILVGNGFWVDWGVGRGREGSKSFGGKWEGVKVLKEK